MVSPTYYLELPLLMGYMDLIQHPLFYVPNKDTYPPFKNGLYLEEYFLRRFAHEQPVLPRHYIPAPWTNFQIEHWFKYKRQEMQTALDDYISRHPSAGGYFTVVQHDDGPMLRLPKGTIVYGACSGDIPIPLIYEDTTSTLDRVPKLPFADKPILCSFVGTMTHSVRNRIFERFSSNPQFQFYCVHGWSAVVNKNKQDTFISVTTQSKFAFAPRGYGRSSFRFFEILKLGTIPVYIWDDIEWLPYKDILDYSKFSISLPLSRLGELESILSSIDDVQYATMLNEYNKVKHWFEFEGMYNYIIRDVSHCVEGGESYLT